MLVPPTLTPHPSQFIPFLLGERIRDKYASSKRKGKYMGGRPILGYDVDRENKRLIVNEKEAEVVRDIFQRFIRCGSATTIMKELNAQGLRTKIWTTLKGKTLGGQPWNKSHLYRLLNNPHYIGHVTHKDKTYPGEHEAIVPQAMWDKVQSILETNHRARGNSTRNETPALLRGLIRCGCCGCAMGPTYTRKKGKTYRYYVCVQASKRGYDSCEIRSISAGPIEEAVLNQLRGIFASPEVIAATYRETRVQEEEALATLRQEQRRLKESLEALQQANAKLMTRAARNGNQEHMQANAAKMAELQAALRDMAEKIGTLEARRLSEQDVTTALQTMEPVWDELFPVEKARIVELLVDRVTVSPDGMAVKLRGDGLHSLITEMQGEQQ